MSACLRKWASQVLEDRGLTGNSVIFNLKKNSLCKKQPCGTGTYYAGCNV